ncbi:GOLGA8N isoform 5, partial [Pongo abelii]
SAPGIHREGPTSSATLKDLESPCQEPAVVPDSRSVKISQLKNTIKSLKQQKKQVEHQLEEEKKANNQKQKAKRELEVQIQRLNTQKGKL